MQQHRTRANPAIALSAAALAAGAACASPTEPVPGDAETLSHDFPSFDVEPGEEHDRYCQSWTLDNDETLWVEAVEMTNGGSFHHSNWFYVPEDRYDGPDGTWECDERGFDNALAGGIGGVLFAQSTQVLEEAQRFGDGRVIAIPPRSRIVGNVHVLHARPEPLETHIQLRLRTIDEFAVDTVLTPFSLSYFGLDLPAHQKSRFTVECEIRGEHLRRFRREPDFSFQYVLPHYHDLGELMRLEGVREDGDTFTIYESSSAVGEPLGGTLSPAVSVDGAHALRLTCGYDNPTDQRIQWGIGDQEMCVFLAFTDSEHKWGGGMLGTAEDNVEVGVEDDVSMNEGPCLLISTEPAPTD